MKAWQCDDTRPLPQLKLVDVEAPCPAAGEILVRVSAAGVTPSELLWYPTTHTKSGASRRHAVPGHEFSGVVAAVGDGVDIHADEEVFGMNDWFADGATAEYCCAPARAVATKPKSLSHPQAATIPISALTVWQGMFDRADLRPHETVLIHGGAGGVGVIAIQLARWRGARVITTASARHSDVLVQLGAERVIDYRTERFEELVSNVDVVFDGVGGDTLSRSWSVLAPGGRLVTIAAQSEVDTDARTKDAFFIVEPNRQQLAHITELIDSGMIRPVVDGIVPFDQAFQAYQREFSPANGIGKMSIVF